MNRIGTYEPNTRHFSAQVLQKIYPKYDEALIFAFVRNPWDRLTTIYEFIREKKKKYSNDPSFSYSHVDNGFDHWLLNTEFNFWYEKLDEFYPTRPTPQQRQNQMELLCDEDDNFLVNRIGFYENLDADFEKICKVINIAPPKDKSVVNKTPNKRDYKSYYSDESREFVAHHFEWDIDVFGYTFE
jgi:hypothetical protein